MLGFSISSPTTQQNITSQTIVEIPQQSTLSASQGVVILRERFGELIELWNSKQKPRTAMVLSTAQIFDDRILVFVPNEMMYDEIVNSKIDIEGDMLTLFNYRLPLEVQVREEVQIDRPITQQQKIEHLTSKNPKVVKLLERLDLTM